LLENGELRRSLVDAARRDYAERYEISTYVKRMVSTPGERRLVVELCDFPVAIAISPESQLWTRQGKSGSPGRRSTLS